MCARNTGGHVIDCQAIRTPHIYYSDKHTSVREAIQISLPNLSEGCSLRSPYFFLFVNRFTHSQSL